MTAGLVDPVMDCLPAGGNRRFHLRISAAAAETAKLQHHKCSAESSHAVGIFLELLSCFIISTAGLPHTVHGIFVHGIARFHLHGALNLFHGKNRVSLPIIGKGAEIEPAGISSTADHRV